MKIYMNGKEKVVLMSEFVNELSESTKRTVQSFYKAIKEFESGIFTIDKYEFSKKNNLKEMVKSNKVIELDVAKEYIKKNNYYASFEEHKWLSLEQAVVYGSQICSKIDDLIRKYTESKKNLSVINDEIVDINHILEFNDLDNNKKLVYVNELTRLFNERRYCKDLTEILEKTYNVLNGNSLDKLKIDLFKAQSDAKKLLNKKDERVYTLRVRNEGADYVE